MPKYYGYHWFFPGEEYAVTSSEQIRKFLDPATATAGGFTVKEITYTEYVAYKKNGAKDLDEFFKKSNNEEKDNETRS